MNRILIAEDEERIAAFLRKGLSSHGFSTETVASGDDAYTWAASGQYDLMILDLGLPVLDGMDVLARLRASGSRMPVIILTARDSVRDTVAGLQSGADDYLGKPFAFDELLARVRLRLQRAGAQEEPETLRAGGLCLDLRTRRIRVDAGARRDRAAEGTGGGEGWQDLTTREFALARQFLANPGHVLSRQQLLSRVWDLDFDPGSNVVDVYVRYLRRKVGEDRIETVRGAGYRLRPEGR